MIQYILTDIEGTTTDINFVKNELFPYSFNKIESFIQSNIHNDLYINEINNLKASVFQVDSSRILNESNCIFFLKKWILDDIKMPALKEIQGILWEEGYLKGDLKAHLYSDVPPSLESWKKKNLKIGVYSSGSKKAQELLFAYSQFGNLTHFFSNFFDTSLGHKREVQSYKNIREEIGFAPFQILFLSDIEEELDAAKEAGYLTCQLVRDERPPTKKHQTAANFLQVSNIFQLI